MEVRPGEVEANPTDTPMSKTNFFRQRREQLELTQAEVARRLNVVPSTVAVWERGEGLPKLKHSTQLAKAYEVSENRIIDAIVASSRTAATAKA
jgi:transcriptional regulator with XRE-family HTH domain